MKETKQVTSTFCNFSENQRNYSSLYLFYPLRHHSFLLLHSKTSDVCEVENKILASKHVCAFLYFGGL